MSIRKSTLSTGIAAALCGAAYFAPSAALADVKMVSVVTIKGQPKELQAAGGVSDKPVTTTTYYKGDKFRSETDAEATITDFTTGKMYTLDPAKKTFTVTNLQDLAKAASSNSLLSNAKASAVTTVTPGSEKKTLLGKEARLYEYSTTFTFKIEGNDTISSMMPTMIIQGKMWNDESLVLPASPQQMAQATYLRMLPTQMMQGVKEMSEKLSTMKGFPLLSTTTMTVVPPKDAPDFVKEMMPKEPMVTTTEVKSVTQDPLPDTLFAVPGDYKEVKVPVAR